MSDVVITLRANDLASDEIRTLEGVMRNVQKTAQDIKTATSDMIPSGTASAAEQLTKDLRAISGANQHASGTFDASKQNLFQFQQRAIGLHSVMLMLANSIGGTGVVFRGLNFALTAAAMSGGTLTGVLQSLGTSFVTLLRSLGPLGIGIAAVTIGWELFTSASERARKKAEEEALAWEHVREARLRAIRARQEREMERETMMARTPGTPHAEYTAELIAIKQRSEARIRTIQDSAQEELRAFDDANKQQLDKMQNVRARLFEAQQRLDAARQTEAQMRAANMPDYSGWARMSISAAEADVKQLTAQVQKYEDLRRRRAAIERRYAEELRRQEEANKAIEAAERTAAERRLMQSTMEAQVRLMTAEKRGRERRRAEIEAEYVKERFTILHDMTLTEQQRTRLLADASMRRADRLRDIEWEATDKQRELQERATLAQLFGEQQRIAQLQILRESEMRQMERALQRGEISAQEYADALVSIGRRYDAELRRPLVELHEQLERERALLEAPLGERYLAELVRQYPQLSKEEAERLARKKRENDFTRAMQESNINRKIAEARASRDINALHNAHVEALMHQHGWNRELAEDYQQQLDYIARLNYLAQQRTQWESAVDTWRRISSGSTIDPDTAMALQRGAQPPAPRKFDTNSGANSAGARPPNITPNRDNDIVNLLRDILYALVRALNTSKTAILG